MEKQNQQQEEESDKQNHVHNQHVEDDFEEEEEKQVDVEEVKHPIPNSPPLDLHHTSSPPLDLHRTSSPSSPPLDLHHTSTPSSPPLDFLHISSPSSPPLDLHHHQSQPTSPPLDLHHTPKSPPPPPPQRKPKPAADGRRFTSSILKRSRTEVLIRRVLLCSRVCGFLFCLVSFSVLASDKNRGWALDSFYHYKEFRYSLAVNVIAFLYSGFQVFDLIYQMTTGKRRSENHTRFYFDFFMDQILTYLLMSSSSSASVRIDDWQLNWGKDEFPNMAKASVGLSFAAFLSLGLSSLISGYYLCTLDSV